MMASIRNTSRRLLPEAPQTARRCGSTRRECALRIFHGPCALQKKRRTFSPRFTRRPVRLLKPAAGLLRTTFVPARRLHAPQSRTRRGGTARTPAEVSLRRLSRCCCSRGGRAALHGSTHGPANGTGYGTGHGVGRAPAADMDDATCRRKAPKRACLYKPPPRAGLLSCLPVPERSGTAFLHRTFPSGEMAATRSETDLPEAATARFTACSSPPQQGTLILATVMLLISFAARIAVSFSV